MTNPDDTYDPNPNISFHPSTQPVQPGVPHSPAKKDVSFKEVKELHKNSDVDFSSQSQHHTLGIRHTQAAPGDHQHDGIGTRKLGYGQALTISGAKGTAASEDSLVTLLKKFIDFTDNRT